MIVVTLLAGCGGGGDDSSPGTTANVRTPTSVGNTAATSTPAPLPPAEPAITPAVGRGELRSASKVATFSAGEITVALQAAGDRTPLVTPRYAVSAYRLTYLTIDGHGQSILASGLVVVPDKAPGAPSPVASYQHATIFHDAEAPSMALLAGEPPMVLASLGAIIVAADYVGYGVSRGAQHPYLLAAPSAAAVVDLLTAARVWRQGGANIVGNGQLFLIGYSEGGYTTLAAQRAIEADPLSPHRATLVGSVPGAGPYDVQVTLDALLQRVREQSPFLASLINPGLLGGLGVTVRNEVRRQLLRLVIPDDADVSFQSTFIDNFLADDSGAIARDSNVSDWKPATHVRLFHGRDDQTVPLRQRGQHAAENARARGAQRDPVRLQCRAFRPSGVRAALLDLHDRPGRAW